MNSISIIPDILILVLSFVGFGALSAAMDRHAKQIFTILPRPGLRRACSTLGWGLLALASWPAIHGYGLAVGIAVWVGFLALSSTAVALLLTYRPTALRGVLPGATLAGVIAALAGLS
jgi:hypothetical protein